MRRLLLGLLFLAPMIAQAQETFGTLQGRVVTSDGQPAELINVWLQGTSLGSVTDSSGHFLIAQIPPGTYTLVVSAVGLETQTRRVTIRAGEVTHLPPVVLRESIAELQEIVVTAYATNYRAAYPSPTLLLQAPLAEIPQNIQVVTADLLRNQQLLNMREGVVRNVSGAIEAEHWAQFTRVHMRGARVAAFRNGLDVSSTWGPLSEDMALVERIEFIKGPAGFKLANGEPVGFYNVVTKKPTGRTRQEVSLSLGSFNLYRATIDLDGQLGSPRLLYRLNVLGYRTESFLRHDFQSRLAIAPVLTYRLSSRTTVTMEYTYQYASLLNPGSVYQFSARGFEPDALPEGFTIADPSLDPSKIRENNFFLYFTHQLNDRWQLRAQGTFFDYRPTGSSIWPAAIDSAGNMLRQIGLWDSHLQQKAAQVFLQGTERTGAVTHYLLIGLDMADKDYFAEFGQYQLLDSEAQPFNIYRPTYGLSAAQLPRFDRSQPLRNRANYVTFASHEALYVQDELRFFEERLRLTLGARFTQARSNSRYNTPFGEELVEHVITPRAGLSVTLRPNTHVYGLYDQTFLPQAGSDAQGRAFKPVRGHNLEVGLKHDGGEGRWNLTLAAYRIVKTNVLTTDPENPNFSVQLGETLTRGIEVDLRGELLPRLDVVLNYAFTDAFISKDTDPEREGDRYGGARHVTNGWATYHLPAGFSVSLGYRWMWDRTSAWASPGAQESLPDYFRLDGGLSWRYDRLQLALNVNNILDATLYTGTRYYSFYYWQVEPPRNFRLLVRYTL